MSILQTIKETIDKADLEGVEHAGAMCSIGTCGRIVQEALLPLEYEFKEKHDPDIYILGIPTWAIAGYPPGRWDLVSRETLEECLRFAGRL